MEMGRTRLAKSGLAGILAMALAATLTGCGTRPHPGDAADRQLLDERVQTTISDFKSHDPSIDRFFNSAYAYAVFPRVVTAAVGVGGAHGNGEVFRRGQLIGYTDVSQGSIGAQLGAEKYAEIVFFENEGSFVDFKQSTMAFDARATAIAASKGAAETAGYQRGVVVFTLPIGGLMAQAAVGGQKFRYEPAGETYRRSTEVRTENP